MICVKENCSNDIDFGCIHLFGVHCNWTEYPKQSNRQIYDNGESKRFIDINSYLISIKNSFLAHEQYQYAFSLITLIALLLLFRRIFVSLKKDVSFLLFNDICVLFKLLHWKNCNYSYFAFATSCFMLFILLLPLLLILWLFVLCYRQYIYYLIKVSENTICLFLKPISNENPTKEQK